MSNKTNGVQLTQKEYLKKYLNKGEKTKKKKTVRKDKRVEIIDDDLGILDSKTDDGDLLQLFASDEDTPQVVQIIDERPVEVKTLEKYIDSQNWKPIGDKKENQKEDLSHSRKRKHNPENTKNRKKSNLIPVEGLSPPCKQKSDGFSNEDNGSVKNIAGNKDSSPRKPEKKKHHRHHVSVKHEVGSSELVLEKEYHSPLRKGHRNKHDLPSLMEKSRGNVSPYKKRLNSPPCSEVENDTASPSPRTKHQEMENTRKEKLKAKTKTTSSKKLGKNKILSESPIQIRNDDRFKSPSKERKQKHSQKDGFSKDRDLDKHLVYKKNYDDDVFDHSSRRHFSKKSIEEDRMCKDDIHISRRQKEKPYSLKTEARKHVSPLRKLDNDAYLSPKRDFGRNQEEPVPGQSWRYESPSRRYNRKEHHSSPIRGRNKSSKPDFLDELEHFRRLERRGRRKEGSSSPRFDRNIPNRRSFSPRPYERSDEYNQLPELFDRSRKHYRDENVSNVGHSQNRWRNKNTDDRSRIRKGDGPPPRKFNSRRYDPYQRNNADNFQNDYRLSSEILDRPGKDSRSYQRISPHSDLRFDENNRIGRLEHHVDDVPPFRRPREFRERRSMDREIKYNDLLKDQMRQDRSYDGPSKFVPRYQESKKRRSISISPHRNHEEFIAHGKRSKQSEDRYFLDHDKHPKSSKTLDGKKSGLQHAANLRNELADLSRNEDRLFDQLGSDLTGRNAAPIARDRRTGKHRNFEEEKQELQERNRQEDAHKEKYYKWGKGLKQVEDAQEKLASDLHEMSKPFARYADDTDLERHYRMQERDGDTMLSYIRQKQSTQDSGKVEKLRYRGAYPPNRFNIPPGHKWDGVDRSNGYEKQYFDHQSRRKAVEEEAYKWSTSDM